MEKVMRRKQRRRKGRDPDHVAQFRLLFPGESCPRHPFSLEKGSRFPGDVAPRNQLLRPSQAPAPRKRRKGYSQWLAAGPDETEALSRPSTPEAEPEHQCVTEYSGPNPKQSLHTWGFFCCSEGVHPRGAS